MDMRDFCDLDDRLCKTCLEPECSISEIGQLDEKFDPKRMTVARYMQSAGWCKDCEYYANANRVSAPMVGVRDKTWTPIVLIGALLFVLLLLWLRPSS
jgi:hypothetical protein